MYVIEPETSLPLVPPARLAALLRARRQQENVDVATIAERSFGLFDVHDIELLESGRSPLTEETIRSVTQLYDLGAGPVVPGRSRLIVDLDMGTIEADGELSHLPRAEPPAVLERYLALVYVMRGVQPGNKIALRRDDMEVLADALDLSPGDVESRVAALMTSPVISRRTRRLSRKLSVPGVGILIGFTTMGAVILAPAAAAEEASPTESSVQATEFAGPQSAVDAIAFTVPDEVQDLDQTVSRPVERDDLLDSWQQAEENTVDETASGKTVASEESRPDNNQLTAGTTEEPTPAAIGTPDNAASIDANDPTDIPEGEQTPVSDGQSEPVAEQQASQTPTPAPTNQPAPAAVSQPASQAPQPAPQTSTTQAPKQAAPAPAPNSPAEIGRLAETKISYDYRAKLPGWTIKYEGNRPGYRGMTNRIEKTVTVYVRDGDTPSFVAEILSHELGHALDLELMNNDQRLLWLEVRGMPQVWWVDDATPDFAAGQGDFAEAIAALWVGSPSDSHHGSFTPEQLALAASFIE